MSGSVDPQAESARSRFLLTLLADEESGRIVPLADYLQRFPEITGFVREEYQVMLARHTRDAAFELRYAVIEPIAVGGMGELALAQDTLLGRKVALKSIRGAVCDARSIERMRREARILSRLEHPAICRILDVVEREGLLTLVLPFHSGVTVAQCIERARAQSPRPAFLSLRPVAQDLVPRQALLELLTYFVGVVEAVQAAHESGVIHRDLKPSNLLVLPDGAPMVLDFGLAFDLKEQSARITMTGENIGTSYYMAPEQIQGQAASARNDVYALGLVLYELLTLERPYRGATREATFQQILGGALAPPRHLNPEIPTALEAIVLRACDRDPARRYSTARELADALRHVLLSLGPARALGWSGGVRLAAALLLVLAVSLAAFRVSSAGAERRGAGLESLRSGVLGHRNRMSVDLDAAKALAAAPRPSVVDPVGTVFQAPRAIRLVGGVPGSRWRIVVRGGRLASPLVREWIVGGAPPTVADAPWEAGLEYRVYLTEVAANGGKEPGREPPPSASQASFVIRPAPAEFLPDDAAALGIAQDLLAAGSANAALHVLDGLDPQRFGDEWLAFLHAVLRVRSLADAGYSGVPLQHAIDDVQAMEPAARGARSRGYLRQLRSGASPTEIGQAIRELSTLLPPTSARGLWARYAIAECQWCVLRRTREAAATLDEALQSAAAKAPWSDEECRRLAADALWLGIDQPTRAAAGCWTDWLAHADSLRGRLALALGEFELAEQRFAAAIPRCQESGADLLQASCLLLLAEAASLLGRADWDAALGRAEQLLARMATRLRIGADDVPRESLQSLPDRIAGVRGAHELRQGRPAAAEPGLRAWQQRLAAARSREAQPDARLEATLLLAECLLSTADPDRNRQGVALVAEVEQEVRAAPVRCAAMSARILSVGALSRLRAGTVAPAALAAELEAAAEDPLLLDAIRERNRISSLSRQLLAGEVK